LDLHRLLETVSFEQAARATLDATTWAYLAGGAGSGRTVAANTAAFEEMWLRPRILRPVPETPDTRVTVLGQSLSMPVLLAPTSPQRLFHPDAEIATVGAAASADTVAIISTDSHYPFAEIGATAKGHWWFQLYPYGSQRDSDAVIATAEEAGATALVVTVDAYHPARRLVAQRSGFRTPPDVDFGTLRELGILTGHVPADTRLPRRNLSWEDLDHVCGRTNLPVLVKGVLNPDDARRCAQAGAAGVIVSNHGGRQLDGALPSLLALPEVAAAVPDRHAVLFDSGIRSGLDVIVALALGAHAVCIGRPYVWGLALAGQTGIEAVLALLRDELEDGLRQLGHTTVGQIGPDNVVKTALPSPGRHQPRQ
jgi:4-hydroxymandelate oxidase